MAGLARTWAAAIEQTLARPVALRDERLSSHLAQAVDRSDAARPVGRSADSHAT